MDCDHRHDKASLAASDILEYYLSDIEDSTRDSEGDPRQTPSDTTAKTAAAAAAAAVAVNSGSNSVYSTYSPHRNMRYSEDDYEQEDAYVPRLRQAIRSLCSIGLRVASLVHDRNIAQEALSAAEDTAAKLGSELLLERLNLDGSPNTDEIADIMVLQTEPLPLDVARDEHMSPSPRLLGLQQAACCVRKLRASLARFEGQLEMEKRLILWPGLEQWRLAVAEHHHRRQLMASKHELDAGNSRDGQVEEQAHPGGDLDQLVCSIRHILPQLGRHRLQCLWEHIGHSLQEGTSSERQETVEPAQMFF